MLVNALEPDSVNNCTVRFHDGFAIISVEDHLAGYIVTVSASSGAGTLNYALATASNEYVSINISLDGQTLDLADVVTSAGEKHVVGNGYTNTILTGGVSCTNKTTFANLGMSGVVNSGGTMTLGDVYIPNGATVSVSGGRLAIEKVTGDGGTIDLGSTNVVISIGATAYASGCTITGGSAGYGGSFMNSGTLVLSSAIISGNYAGAGGGGILVTSGHSVVLRDSIVSGNIFNDLETGVSTSIDLLGGNTIGTCVTDGTVSLSGVNSIGKVTSRTTGGFIIISSGASIYLTSSINPGGGITFDPSGATVYPSAGSASAVTLGGGTFGQITSTGVVKAPVTNLLSGTVISGNATIDMNNTNFKLNYTSNKLLGVIISGGSASDYGGACWINDAGPVVSGVTFTGNQAGFRGAAISMLDLHGKRPTFENCVFSGNVSAGAKGAICVVGASAAPVISNCRFYGEDIIGFNCGGSMTIAGTSNMINNLRVESGSLAVIISSGASINLTSSITPGGGITILEGGCTINNKTVSATVTPYSSIVNSGGTLYIDGNPVE